MSIYNFSSVNSKNYNTLRVRLPNHFLTQYVNLTVSTFTCNCNIEVMNEDDYITFRIDYTKYKVYMLQYSNLDSSSLPYIIEDQLKIILKDPNDKEKPRIRVSMTNVNTIKFTCDVPFEITDMSYNMKLLTGYYCMKDSDFPIKSTSFEEKYNVFDDEKKDKDLTEISYVNKQIRIKDVVASTCNQVPKDAYGFSTSYESDNIDIATIDEEGYITGIGAGKAKITAKIWNPKSSQHLPPDFTRTFTVEVAEAEEVEVEYIVLPNELELTETEDYTIYPNVVPFKAKYTELWVSDNPEIATVANGYIRAISAGTTMIHYQLKAKGNVYEASVVVKVNSQWQYKTNHRIISDSVGYMLSTPILYLLTNIGNSIFFNEIHDQNKIQCGTVCMCMNNSYASSMPIVAMQGDITTKCAINATSDIFFILVDANMRPVKLLNPFYITVNVRPDEDQPMITPGILPQ